MYTPQDHGVEELSSDIRDRYTAYTFPASQTGPDTKNKCDLEFCNECGNSGDPANMGVYIDTCDIGDNATGGVAEIATLEVQNHWRGEFQGFTEDDIGYWCDKCWSTLLSKRTT